MNILLAHFRVGETDGVSLEMDKWKQALEALGHNVHYMAGSSGSCQALLIPEMHYLNPVNDKIIHNAYVELTDFESEAVLLNEINSISETISHKIIEVINNYDIDIVVPNNIWSLGYHLPAAIGLMKAIESTSTKVICHHHDFHWEREKYSNPTVPGISALLEQYFPPSHPLIRHCVINRIAQTELKQRRGVDSVVVPNVFDFHGNQWEIDSFNEDLRERFGIKENDLFFLQATRIVERKGIEIALDLLSKLNEKRDQLVGKTLYNGRVFTEDSRIILVFAGMNEDEPYLALLKDKAAACNVELLFINESVGHSRRQEDGTKVYSLWDVYCHADIITYPSLLEGWGNQFLEGLIARVPMAVYRYPVYDLDIADYKFNIIDLGNTHTLDETGLAVVENAVLDKAVDQTLTYLLDKDLRKQNMDVNYQIGEKNFSYPALRTLLASVFNSEEAAK
ncbi:glycosyltransferase [Vibrio sp. HN007]|uniref:glycosyltransferase n=1 Tax=Vibrio iocasae TaxID=3098914 RepID=UPI0035D433B9